MPLGGCYMMLLSVRLVLCPSCEPYELGALLPPTWNSKAGKRNNTHASQGRRSISHAELSLQLRGRPEVSFSWDLFWVHLSLALTLPFRLPDPLSAGVLSVFIVGLMVISPTWLSSGLRWREFQNCEGCGESDDKPRSAAPEAIKQPEFLPCWYILGCYYIQNTSFSFSLTSASVRGWEIKAISSFLYNHKPVDTIKCDIPVNMAITKAQRDKA